MFLQKISFFYLFVYLFILFHHTRYQKTKQNICGIKDITVVTKP